ncbi:hypothetical protein GJAV_G00232000 [Gymnothorax javanicus]|nr:hypothetical protein GJAV_G00232000 [Gymnothorax javanicus]
MANRKRQESASRMSDPVPRPSSAPFPLREDEEVTQDGEEGPQLPHYAPQDPVSEDSRPTTPRRATPDYAHTGRRPHPASVDGDSSSDYVNNTSDEEEDFDEGLPEEDEGVTYYIRYCPEDDSYLEGAECSEGEYDNVRSQPRPDREADESQEAVGEWVEPEGRSEAPEEPLDERRYEGSSETLSIQHPASLSPSHLGTEETEAFECEGYCQQEVEEGEEPPEGGHYGGDCYAPEHAGNSVPVSSHWVTRGRRDRAGVAERGEDAEEDIDQIVAEIKMSMSSDRPETPAQPEPQPAPCTPHRHEGRPKSLNIPPAHHITPELRRGVRSLSPEERPPSAQEQVSHSVDQPRKQQRSDLNGPVEETNITEQTKKAASFPSFVDVPGPCEPEDLIDGIIFAANYLGSTQLLSERNPSKHIRMTQAQEAVSRVKSPEGDSQILTEVDLFISTQRIKVLNADTQEAMMDNALRTISYIADIGNIVVLMARRRMPRTASQDCIETTPGAPECKKQYKMICHVFESEDAQLIAQSIGQAFSVAYQEFLRANGINPEDLSQKDYSDIINTEEMYNDDLVHFSNSENCKELQLEKRKGEILGVVIVESGWGSILPTVILANMMNGGPVARSGKLSIGDQIMSINNTSLVGLPLASCQGIIKGLKNQVQVKLNIVSCPPVTTVLIKRPDLKYQLGFSVQNGIICSLMRGGIAERGGVRVGHRIIEINGQSVVATAHEKIVQALSNSVGEIHMKTMPAAMFRLLTGQETPMYI